MIDCMAGGIGPSSGVLAGGLASMLLLPAAGLGVAFQMAKGRSGRPRRPPPPRLRGEDLAVAALKERYARGEIDHDELDRRLHLLLSR